MWHEISRRAINTNRNDEPSLSWHNSILSVKTEKGIQLFDFAYNLESFEKKLDLEVSIIHNPKLSPAAGLFPDQFLQYGLSNEDVTQMVLEPGLWPHNIQLTIEMATIISYEWSPIGMIHGTESILAILNNVGHVELFGQENHKWSTVLDLSEAIKAHCFPSLQSTIIKCLDDLRNVVNVVETCACSWGPLFEDHSCFFVTAQKNGKILIWLLQSLESEIHPQLNAEIQTDIGEIFSVLWIPMSDKKLLLICPNMLGQIFALDCEIIKDHIELVNTSCIWEHKDRMVAKHLVYTVNNNKIVLLCNKHRHLLVQQLNYECQVLSQCIKNVNDYRITDITDSKDGIYLATANCKIYKIYLNYFDDNFDVSLSQIQTKDEYGMYELHSLKTSTNSVIWAAAMADRTIQSRKYPEKIDIIFFCTDPQNHLETTILLENPSKKLTNYWDCIELLRCKTMKSKALPSIDYLDLYNDTSSDVYKMKLYHIFVILYNALDKIMKNSSRGLLPETSIEVVRDKICLTQAVTLIKLVHQNRNDTISGFELECYSGGKNYIEYYCRKYNKNSNEFIEPSLLNLTKMVPLYTCQGCEEIINGFMCKNKHYNMFCSLTFTPIENDYIACKNCNSTAKIELYNTRPTCLFCDLYLSRFHEGL